MRCDREWRNSLGTLAKVVGRLLLTPVLRPLEPLTRGMSVISASLPYPFGPLLPQGRQTNYAQNKIEQKAQTACRFFEKLRGTLAAGLKPEG